MGLSVDIIQLVLYFAIFFVVHIQIQPNQDGDISWIKVEDLILSFVDVQKTLF